MGRASENSERVATFLKKALESFNPGHLAASSRRRNPEFKLVEHVRDKLTQNFKVGSVLKHFKNVHTLHEGVNFLYQPEVDLAFLYEGFLHGVEFKLLGDNSSFYHGIEEALAYSTYGIDFSWIVHFYKMNYKDSSDYWRWMKYTIERSKCSAIGYIISTTKSSNVLICPTKPFSRSAEMDEKLKRAVKHVRKDLFDRIRARDDEL
jgi:hypothetical protein